MLQNVLKLSAVSTLHALSIVMHATGYGVTRYYMLVLQCKMFTMRSRKIFQ